MKNADLLFFKCSARRKQEDFGEFQALNKNYIKTSEKALNLRDKEDRKRKISPLIKVKNAVLVDTSKITIKQMEKNC